MPLKCDEKGNVYARFFSGFLPSSEIVKITPDGARAATYDYARVSGLENASATDFALGGARELYEMVEVPTETGHEAILLRFSEDGTFKDKSKLIAPKVFVPSRLLILQDGNLFISGVVSEGREKGKAFNGIFKADGRLIRDFALKGDAKPLEHSALNNEPTILLNPAVASGQAMLGADGNIYLFRHLTPAFVYVVSPAGQLVQTLTVKPPVEKAEPVGALMGSTSMAILFQVPDESDVSNSRIRVVSLQTGEAITDYKISPELGSAIACYASDRFTFIGMMHRQRSLVQASTR